MTAQAIAALARAKEVKVMRARQMEELRGQSAPTITAALRNPPAELATYRLGQLFAPKTGRKRSLVPSLGVRRFGAILTRLSADPTLGRQAWHTELRLNELCERERCALVAAVLSAAPAEWGEGCE